MKKTAYVTHSALIAALYIVFTFVSSAFSLSSGAVQLRLSEALCVLPSFTFAAVPGLFIGCFGANMLTGAPLWDVFLGSAATLLGALGTYYFGKSKWLAPLFPIISNTIIIPLVLKYVYGLSGAVWYMALTVFAGEVVSCAILGTILYVAVEKSNVFK